MSLSSKILIRPATGVRLELGRGQVLRVIDVEGQQVADLTAFASGDGGEWLCSGRTFDYNGTILLTKGHALYSNRSNVLFRIVEDTAGRHDFLLAPCSPEMFRIQYGEAGHHPNCLENLAACLEQDGIDRDRIPTAFNVFMHVDVDPGSGSLTIQPPSSRRGDHVDLLVERDVVVAVAACSAENTNQGRLKPIEVEVHRGVGA